MIRERSLWAGVAAIAVAACGPKIDHFDVSPVRACVGDSVRIAYAVHGTPQLTVVRHGAPPSDTTAYQLTATRHGKVKFARKEVVTFWPGNEKTLAFDTDSVVGDSIASTDTLPAQRWGSIPLWSVASASGRGIRVTHNGKTAVLPSDGRPSDDLRGTPIAGVWEMRAPILPGETPGVPQHAPPASLRLHVAVCGAGSEAP